MAHTASANPFELPSHRASLILASTTLAIGVAQLAWWGAILQRWAELGSFLPSTPVASFIFALLSLALILHLKGAASTAMRRIRLALVCVAGVATLEVWWAAIAGTASWSNSILDPTNVMVRGRTIGSMQGYTAVLFLLTIAGFVGPFVTLRSGWPKECLRWISLGGPCAALLLTVSYAAGNPAVATTGRPVIVPATAVGFLFLNLALLLEPGRVGWIRRWLFGTETDAGFSREERKTLAVLAAAALLMILGGSIFVHRQGLRHRALELKDLHALADLKVSQITQWRNERLGDGHAILASPALASIAASIVHGSQSADAKRAVLDWFEQLEKSYGYAAVVLLDDRLQPVLSSGKHELAPAARTILLAAERDDRDVIELPPYVDLAGELRLDLLARVRDQTTGKPVAAIVLQSDPAHSLFPIVSKWPEDRRTGQSLLWHRENDRLISLGGYRDLPGTDVNALRPFGIIRDLDGPGATPASARVINGQLTEGEEIDYRGIPTIGVVERVPDSTWYLLNRVDAVELYAPLRYLAYSVSATIGGFMALIAVGVSILWRRRQSDLLRQRMAAEIEQRRLAARLGSIMQHAKDIILVLDENLRIIDANEQAVAAYGWPKHELLGRHAREMRTPEAAAGFDEVAQLARRPGAGTFETIHRRRDGTSFPVEISSTPVEFEGHVQWISILRDITDRKKAEAELRASEERYRLIADNTSDVIWLYDTGREGFIYVSNASRSVFGYDPSELLGKILWHTVVPTEQDKVKGMRRQLLESAADASATQHVVIEVMQARKDGSVFPTEVVSSALPGRRDRASQILGITRDISERRRAQQVLEQFNADLERQVAARTAELAQRNQEMQALVGSIPDTVMLCDSSGTVATVRASPLIPQDTPINGAATQIARKVHAAVLERREPVVREFDRIVDGSELSIEARATLVSNDRSLVLLRDISARKKMERDILAHLAREKQLSDMKSQFISVASHEFRTPLAAAMGSLDLLERHATRITEEKRTELVGRTKRALERLTAIMNDVLQLSRADSGRVKVKRMHVDLPRFVADVIDEVRAGDAANHEFELRSSGAGKVVPVDTNLMHHILSNLAGNAVRYSPAGTKVTVALDIGQDAFEVTVADEGIGIPEMDRDRIFEPFARGSNVGQIGGTGLGLNIVKRYSDLMGGSISLVPSRSGAIFRVVIPFNQASS
jgi:PAS domain S-box-containing protein